MQDSLKWWGKTLQLVGNQTEPRSQTAGRQASIIRKHKTEIHERLCVFLYGGGCIVYIQLLSFFQLLDCLFFLYHLCIKGREGGENVTGFHLDGFEVFSSVRTSAWVMCIANQPTNHAQLWPNVNDQFPKTCANEKSPKSAADPDLLNSMTPYSTKKLPDWCTSS